MWWLLTQHFGLRGRQELHNMKVNDFQLCKDDKYVEFLQFTEGQTKTRQGGLHTKHRDFQPRMFAVGGERCPVALFKQFQTFSKPEDDWSILPLHQNEAARAISAFWKTHSCKLIPNLTCNRMDLYLLLLLLLLSLLLLLLLFLKVLPLLTYGAEFNLWA